MHDWYSGLIPYPILLPLQIALLMIMSAVVMREMQAARGASGDGKLWLRGIAIVYFAVMLLRLIVQLMRGADERHRGRRHSRGISLGAGAVPARARPAKFDDRSVSMSACLARGTA